MSVHSPTRRIRMRMPLSSLAKRRGSLREIHGSKEVHENPRGRQMCSRQLATQATERGDEAKRERAHNGLDREKRRRVCSAWILAPTARDHQAETEGDGPGDRGV